MFSLSMGRRFHEGVHLSNSSNGKQASCVPLDENDALFQNKTKQIHPTPIRMATKKNITKTEIASIGEGLETLQPWCAVGGSVQNSIAAVENSMKLPPKLKIELP